jgi:broad specificity phosphatase PhoE
MNRTLRPRGGAPITSRRSSRISRSSSSSSNVVANGGGIGKRAPGPPRRRRPAPTPSGGGVANFFFGNHGDGTAAADANAAHVVFVRHGTTEMNEYLHTQCSYYSPEFKDPLIFDTRLTKDGARRAREAAGRAARLQPRPDLIVASPLTRALQTAELAFAPLLDAGVPCLALPLARERLFLSSDVGRPGGELAAEFPRWRESLLALEDGWWLHDRRAAAERDDGGSSEVAAAAAATAAAAAAAAAATTTAAAAAAAATTATTAPPRRSSRRLKTPTPNANAAVQVERDGEFAARMDALGDWLSSRPERCVAVVTHWGVILEATGHEFENVEMRSFRRSQLRL